MVKREDARDSSWGRARDTDPTPVQPIRDEADDTGELPEGRYKPEMGTVVVHEYKAPLEP